MTEVESIRSLLTSTEVGLPVAFAVLAMVGLILSIPVLLVVAAPLGLAAVWTGLA